MENDNAHQNSQYIPLNSKPEIIEIARKKTMEAEELELAKMNVETALCVLDALGESLQTNGTPNNRRLRYDAEKRSGTKCQSMELNHEQRK